MLNVVCVIRDAIGQNKLKDYIIVMRRDKILERLRHLGVKIPTKTLYNWAESGLIPAPKPQPRDPKVGRPLEEIKQGRSMDWPDATVEEVAAVWLIRKKLGKKDAESIKRARYYAKQYHKYLISDIQATNRFIKPDVSSKSPPSISSLDNNAVQEFLREEEGGSGRKVVVGTYTQSYELHPLITLWITAVEKERSGVMIDKPVKVVFDWAALGTQEAPDLPRFRGVRLEEAEKDTITIHRYRPDTIYGYEFEREHYPEHLSEINFPY